MHSHAFGRDFTRSPRGPVAGAARRVRVEGEEADRVAPRARAEQPLVLEGLALLDGAPRPAARADAAPAMDRMFILIGWHTTERFWEPDPTTLASTSVGCGERAGGAPAICAHDYNLMSRLGDGR